MKWQTVEGTESIIVESIVWPSNCRIRLKSSIVIKEVNTESVEKSNNMMLKGGRIDS
jgi:hypothetical protein